MIIGLLLSLLAFARAEEFSINAPPTIGYGVKRLKNFRNHFYRVKEGPPTVTSCENTQEYRFAGAVVDNFAPINAQTYWSNGGQRYWINKELWGGEGYPIFVFIGGEGQESCSRLSNKMYMYNLAQEHKALLVDVEHRLNF
jgi:hypothetical protein